MACGSRVGSDGSREGRSLGTGSGSRSRRQCSSGRKVRSIKGRRGAALGDRARGRCRRGRPWSRRSGGSRSCTAGSPGDGALGRAVGAVARRDRSGPWSIEHRHAEGMREVGGAGVAAEHQPGAADQRGEGAERRRVEPRGPRRRLAATTASASASSPRAAATRTASPVAAASRARDLAPARPAGSACSPSRRPDGGGRSRPAAHEVAAAGEERSGAKSAGSRRQRREASSSDEAAVDRVPAARPRPARLIQIALDGSRRSAPARADPRRCAGGRAARSAALVVAHQVEGHVGGEAAQRRRERASSPSRRSRAATAPPPAAQATGSSSSSAGCPSSSGANASLDHPADPRLRAGGGAAPRAPAGRARRRRARWCGRAGCATARRALTAGAAHGRARDASDEVAGGVVLGIADQRGAAAVGAHRPRTRARARASRSPAPCSGRPGAARARSGAGESPAKTTTKSTGASAASSSARSAAGTIGRPGPFRRADRIVVVDRHDQDVGLAPARPRDSAGGRRGAGRSGRWRTRRVGRAGAGRPSALGELRRRSGPRPSQLLAADGRVGARSPCAARRRRASRCPSSSPPRRRRSWRAAPPRAAMAPAASARAKVPITVSPAPVTSATWSVPCTGRWRAPTRARTAPCRGCRG